MDAKRVLAIGVAVSGAAFAPAAALAPEGLLIVMDGDPLRAGSVRRFLAASGLETRATIIAGDPRRMLHKLAGPFDMIFCGDCDPSVRARAETLLATGGVVIDGSEEKGTGTFFAGDTRKRFPSPFLSDPITKSVVEALERISTLNPALNAFITVFEAEAIAQARALDEELRQGHTRGPVHGWIVSIKDLIDMEGVPTTAASRSRLTHVATTDATIVSRLRKAGAVIIGKCNLHEFALGTTSDESAFGAVHHPRDVRRSPGGSSGGSAAAVAAGLGRASVGTDTGGSVRIPAAACGVVGLKPTFAEIPTAGVLPLSVSLDHAGPIARNVGDAWTLFGVLKGSGEIPSAPRPVSGITLGKLGGYFADVLDADVRRLFDAATDRLVDAGAAVREIGIAVTAKIGATYSNVVLTEAFAFHANALEDDAEGYSSGVRQRLAMGRDIPAVDYVEAQGSRSTLRKAVDEALAHCDALILPTLPIPAPMIGADTVDVGGGAHLVRPLMLRLTQLFNLTGHPAITLPCGDTADGLPCGFQLVGRRQDTAGLLAVALSCETHLMSPSP